MNVDCKKYEYRTEERFVTHFADVLNEYGQEGWECFQVDTVERNADSFRCLFYLKREITPEVKPKQTIQEYFKQFLVDNNCYEDYKYNLCMEKDIEKFLNNTPYALLIEDAFTWGKSKQGYNYWYGIDKKWELAYEEWVRQHEW